MERSAGGYDIDPRPSDQNTEAPAQQPELKLSPEQAHDQAKEAYQQAKSDLVQTRDGRYWLSKLRWYSTETTGHHMVGVNRNELPDEVVEVSEVFFQTKIDLAESFRNLPVEAQNEMRPDVEIREPDNDHSHTIDLKQLAKVPDAHHHMIHARHNIRRGLMVDGSESLSLLEDDYGDIGEAWAIEEYLMHTADRVESCATHAHGYETNPRMVRMGVSTFLRDAQRQAVDVGDQDVELGLHELRSRLISIDSSWEDLLDWEA